jgi:predicted ATPase
MSAAVQRIVLTGGPGGGKTTAADLFRREFRDQVALVPEAATMLFSGGFPRPAEVPAQEHAQQAIFHVQRHLEDIETVRHAGRMLLCDRGTVDGGAYWPHGPDDFFATVGTTRAAELDRYHAVIFFESAARGGLATDSGNRWRIESDTEAADLDRRLRALWATHPRFYLVPHHVSFLRKLTSGMAILESLLNQREES